MDRAWSSAEYEYHEANTPRTFLSFLSRYSCICSPAKSQFSNSSSADMHLWALTLAAISLVDQSGATAIRRESATATNQNCYDFVCILG